MHELVIAQGIIDTIVDYADKEKKVVKGFTVAVGELASFDKDIIMELLDTLRKETILKDTEIKLIIEKAFIKCSSCNSHWGTEEVLENLDAYSKEMIHFLPELVTSFAKCPKCGGRDLRILSGRSIKVTDIELK